VIAGARQRHPSEKSEHGTRRSQDDRRGPRDDSALRCRHRHRQHLLHADLDGGPQPSVQQRVFPFAIIGFALVEAVALFALLIAFLILFT
jgi:hypothetical protein